MSTHIDTDISAEMSDGRWLGYDELARLRRIDKPSAVKLATRNRWRRRKNNTGQMQVFVPVDWLDRAQDRRDRYTDKSTDKSADISPEISALRDAIDTLRENNAGLRDGLDHTLALLADAQARGDRAEAALAGERSRADVLRDRVDTLIIELREAQEAAGARVDDAALGEAQERAQQAESRGDAARAQTEELRVELGELRAQLDVLRTDETARQSMSRWRRAWDGWRGR